MLGIKAHQELGHRLDNRDQNCVHPKIKYDKACSLIVQMVWYIMDIH